MLGLLPRKQKNRLRGQYERLRIRWIAAFRSFGQPELLACLRDAGIQEGDTVMLHAGFSAANGFRGTTGAVADTFLEAVGVEGNLIMMSLPYRDSSYAYLSRTDRFDVRKTPSRMGLISEFFRRRPGVLRSLNPAHPVLAFGPKAEWIVEGHEDCLYSCGPGSPFDKALELGAKVAFFDAAFDTFTFFHWLEHHVQEHVEAPLYYPEPFHVPVVDHEGQERTVTTYVYAPEIIGHRRFPVFEDAVRRAGLVTTRRVGNTTVEVARLEDIVACVDDMTSRGELFYHFD